MADQQHNRFRKPRERRREENVRILEDTLAILARGRYEKNGTVVPLALSQAQMREIRVFLPEEVHALPEPDPSLKPGGAGSRDHAPCEYSCENADAFALACQRYRNTGDPHVLVLNLANAVHPGGGVRSGASAQEESLCRRSSLLLSLESAQAARYYDYNRSLHSLLGSDAVMVTPEAVVFKDEQGGLLDQPFSVSVMTCAAPNLGRGTEGLSQDAYEAMVFGRITGMLRCAAYLGYKNLVLGAFGCGAFCNDAAVVSDLFRKAMDQFAFGGRGTKDLFSHIDFAVLCFPGRTYNFGEFSRNFSA